MVAEAETAMNTNGERLYEAELHRLKGEILLAQEGKKQRQKAKGNLPKISIPNPQSLTRNRCRACSSRRSTSHDSSKPNRWSCVR